MDRLQYMLGKLAEECIEVSKECIKAQNFGLESSFMGDSNADRIRDELQDVFAVIKILNEEFALNFGVDSIKAENKESKIERYYLHSKEMGYVK